MLFLLIAAVLVQIYHETEFIAGKVFDVLLLFVFAAIVALLLTPLVDRVQKVGILGGQRSLAVLVVNLSLLLVLAAFLSLIIPAIVSQATALGEQTPRMMAQLQGAAGSLESWLNSRGIPVHFAVPSDFNGVVAPVLGSAFGIASGVLGGIINLLLVAVIAVFLQIQGRDMIAALRQLFPRQQQFFDFTLVAAGSTLGRYVRGQVIFAAIVAAITAIALSVVGVQFALVIAVVTFFLELVPLAGAPIAMLVAVLIALTQGAVVTTETAVATLVIHGALAYTLGLKVVGDAARVHPLVAMLALVLGAQLGGVLGALFAIPIAGIVNVYLGAMYRARRGESAFALPEQAEPTTLADLPNLGEEIAHRAEEERTGGRRKVARKPDTGAGSRTAAGSATTAKRRTIAKPTSGG